MEQNGEVADYPVVFLALTLVTHIIHFVYYVYYYNQLCVHGAYTW